MNLHIRFLFFITDLILIASGFGAAPAHAASKALAPAQETAAFSFPKAQKAVREKYPDSVLLSIDGLTDPKGSTLCRPQDPYSEGWRFHFYSRSSDTYLLMVGCRGSVAGPLKEIKAINRGAPEPILGKFIDSDEILVLLRKKKISLDPKSHQAGGKRPFSFQLFRSSDKRVRSQPVFWKIQIGRDLYVIDAKSKKFLKGSIEQ